MTTLPIRLDGWTVDDLDDLPDELRYELVDGGLLMSPPRLVRHEYANGRRTGAAVVEEPFRVALDVAGPLT